MIPGIPGALRSEWLVVPRRSAAPRMHVVCFPNAGSGMATFAAWSRRLPADVGVVLAQLPGRDNRRNEACCTTASQAADAIAKALLELGAVPCVLFGHSMGALIAFETSRRLQAAGAPAAALVVSARRAPALADPLPPIAHLPMEAFLDEVQRRYGGIPQAVRDEPELRDLLVPTLRADVALVESYRHSAGEPLASPIFAYGGLDDPHATYAELLAWQRESAAVGRTRQFAGGHFYLQSALDQVLDALLSDLDAAQVGRP